MVDRQHILDEIRRTAKENGGVPLGRDRFEQETGIRYTEWYGKHWVRWNEAVQEAGFSPNAFQDAYSDESVIENLIGLIRELRHFPVTGELRIKRHKDRSFPNDKVFYAHFGSRDGVRNAVIEYCRTHAGFDDVLPLCGPAASNGDREVAKEKLATGIVGFVYLVKHGKHYKIGKTNAIGRREYELAIQLPEKLRTIHVIKTDDPDGIEEYWHKRFASKRGNGEWFDLELSDVQAFKRRKFM
jgi:hypothetical protein